MEVEGVEFGEGSVVEVEVEGATFEGVVGTYANMKDEAIHGFV